MTTQDIEEIKRKHEDVIADIYSIFDKKTGNWVVAYAKGEKVLCRRLRYLNIETISDLRQFLTDVKDGKNTRYKITKNKIDISDPTAHEDEGARLKKQESFDALVRSDINHAVWEELRKFESYLYQPKESRIAPNGFDDWAEFVSYYKKIKRWHCFRNAGLSKSLPPLRDGEKIDYYLGKTIAVGYEPPLEKAANIGFSIIGFGWFAFIGISFLVCLLMKANGCISGCSSYHPSEYDQWKSENPPWN